MYAPNNAATLHFSKIINPSDFNADRLIATGRKIINHIDPDICGFIASFNLHSEGNGEYELQESAITKLNGAPSELLENLVRYIDFSELYPSLQEKNILTLARMTARRFEAVSLIAHGKKLKGDTDCFDEERHNDVLATKRSEIAILCGDSITGSKAFSDFMDAGCTAQNAYLNNAETPEQPITDKLRQLGLHLT